MENLHQLEIIPKWPHRFNPQDGDPVPSELIGATIVAIGTFDPNPDHLEGGGLAIDYKPKEAQDILRIVLAFNEGGMWRHPLPRRD
jgi:hypothetical protein